MTEQAEKSERAKSDLVSMSGRLKRVVLSFDTDEVLVFNVNALLTAQAYESITQGEEDFPENLDSIACLLGREYLRRSNPDHAYTKLGVADFMRKVVASPLMKTVPDYGAMDYPGEGLLDPKALSSSPAG